MTNQPVVNEFKNSKLNKIGAELISLSKAAGENFQKAKIHLKLAIINRWNRGRIIAENYDEIIEECDTQREFAERLGLTEAMISNDKRGYIAAKEKGATTEEEFLNLLKQKKIPARTDRWEKLPKLLNQPSSKRQKDNRRNDEKRLEKIYEEAEEIRARNQNTGGEIPKKAEEIEHYISDLQDSLSQTNPLSYKWKSQYYIDWVKSLGMDFLTMQPADNIDAHHTTTEGWAGNTQEKLPDCFTIPVTRDTHNNIERGKYNPSHRELSDALIRTLSLFIITHFKK